MNVSPISIQQHHRNIRFRGNTNPVAVLAKRQEVLKELNVATGTSYIANRLREPKVAENLGFLLDIWQKLKENIPLANSVEKLELLKSYGISLLNYSDEGMTTFLNFLKSNPSDKDIYFLQTAMDIARKGEIESIEEGKEHNLFDDFEPVFNFVTSNKKRNSKYLHAKQSPLDDEICRMEYRSLSFHRWINITKADADNIVSVIPDLISGKYEPYPKINGHHNYGIRRVKTNDSGCMTIGAIDTNGDTEITIGPSHNDFYNVQELVPPTDRPFFILLDKDKKLSKLKLYIYQEYKKNYSADYLNYIEQKLFNYKLSDDIPKNIKQEPTVYEYYKKQCENLRKAGLENPIYLERYESPFGEKLPNWVRHGYDHNEYMLKTIEYDAKTKTAELKNYSSIERVLEQKFRLADSSSDQLGIMTDENNPISFIPIEPTIYDLKHMINDDKTNNLIKVLDISGWKECFMKVINTF